MSSKIILVCQHTYCRANGSKEVLEAFELEGVYVMSSGCQGQCTAGPTVRILPDETWYAWIKPSDVPQIVEQDIKLGKPIIDKLNPRIHPRFAV